MLVLVVVQFFRVLRQGCILSFIWRWRPSSGVVAVVSVLLIGVWRNNTDFEIWSIPSYLDNVEFVSSFAWKPFSINFGVIVCYAKVVDAGSLVEPYMFFSLLAGLLSKEVVVVAKNRLLEACELS